LNFYLVKKRIILSFDIQLYLAETNIKTGETNLIWRRRSNRPGNSQAKGPYIITLESRLSLTEGANLSGKKTDGV